MAATAVTSRREWDVTIELQLADDSLDDLADDLMDVLGSLDPVVSVVDDRLVLAVTVVAATYAAAMSEAGPAIAAGFVELGRDLDPHAIVRCDARTAEATQAFVDHATYPQMVGVAEVAELLDVSKQRVFELRAAGRLPAPLTELRAGPVWPRPAIERWLEGWTRAPGRPRAGRSDRVG